MDDLIIYNTDDGQANVSLLAKDGTVWCTQAHPWRSYSTCKKPLLVSI